MTDDDVLAAIRRGVSTHHRLRATFPAVEATAIRDAVARLIFSGAVKTQGKRLVVA